MLSNIETLRISIITPLNSNYIYHINYTVRFFYCIYTNKSSKNYKHFKERLLPKYLMNDLNNSMQLIDLFVIL